MTLLLDLMNLDRALTPEERRRLKRYGQGDPPRRQTHSKARPTALPGPDEWCASCAHLDSHKTYRKTFYKCGLVNWTHGAATDIRKSDPACAKWEAAL